MPSTSTSLVPKAPPAWNLSKWVKPAGPRQSPTIAIVGEAPSEDEEKAGIAFIGRNVSLLRSMLDRAEIRFDRCYRTNVFLERPPMGNLAEWAIPKREAETRWTEMGREGKYPAEFLTRAKGKTTQLFLEPERLDALDRLRQELEEVKPNLVIALGNTATWALTGNASISKARGTLQMSSLVPGLKVLPTYHYTAVNQQWDLFPIMMADLKKAQRVQHTPQMVLPRRQIWIKPTLADCWEYFNRFLVNSKSIAIDVETKQKQITCIGFAGSPYDALVVPFWDTNTRDQSNYWPTKEKELKALAFVNAVLQLPNPKCFQNGLYDLQYIWFTWGMTMKGRVDDTMLLHHSLQPELQKGLGFLGSIYTDEPSWKHMRKRKSDTEKRDE